MKITSIKLVFTLAILTIITSCNNKYSKIEKANWFIGDWENASDEGSFREIWTKKNDSIYSGLSIVVIEQDTVFYENVSLEQKNDSVFYNVSVKGQNKDEAVSFYLTSSDNDKLVFENPNHDYPSKITYSKVTKDSIVAEIFGLKDGKKITESFPMNRKQ
ncbi:DUF6265 family protein [Flavobacterium sp.]|jgi:hypothetical protein|uniref:DUF6265 family protein n=1 Tax=Flavobacterium sp. TaxID=239 RepID=UPI0037C14D2B